MGRRASFFKEYLDAARVKFVAEVLVATYSAWCVQLESVERCLDIVTVTTDLPSSSGASGDARLTHNSPAFTTLQQSHPDLTSHSPSEHWDIC